MILQPDLIVPSINGENGLHQILILDLLRYIHGSVLSGCSGTSEEAVSCLTWSSEMSPMTRNSASSSNFSSLKQNEICKIVKLYFFQLEDIQ